MYPEIYIKFIEKFDKEKGISALKHHFSDVCSGGDVIINKAIDYLNNNNLVEFQKLYEEKKNLIDDYLFDLMKMWIDEGVMTPDPHWAS